MAAETRRFVLQAEGGVEISAPSPEDIAEIVEVLSPQDGCGLMSIEEECLDAWGDYVQAAGGRNAETGVSRFTVERRLYVRDGNAVDLRRPFQHLVAGLPGRSAAEAVHIETNGFHVTVRVNEVLSKHDVVAIMTAFLTSRALPAAYHWRSNREEVEEIVRDTAAGHDRH